MIHWWHTLFSLFFAVLAVYAALFLDSLGALPVYVPFFDVVLIVLATFRLVRLFSYDVITKFIREWFVGKDPHTLLGTLGTLINCPWCTGLWFALLTTFFYALSPLAWFFIFLLAVGGVASLIQVTANWIGWNAEIRKKECERLG
jgi:hypothetical protein